MTARRTALVIDDDADMRELIAALLESAGIEADLIADGIDALELKKDYDVVLVDLNMPVFDGERLLDYWSLTRGDILGRVIVLTGYARSVRRRHLPPVFAMIAKPFDHHRFLQLVTKCAAREMSS
ncbi:MAG TPA: response regulator [Thermoanaerobaculia bacterium]|nr:response regulator [Thermoanaerobaculia bacterium]